MTKSTEKKQPIMRNCGTCACWRPRDDEGAPPDSGWCHAHPPVPVCIAMKQVVSDWPSTHKDEWCREHTLVRA